MNALDQYLLLRIFAPVSAWWGRLTGARVSDQVRRLCPGMFVTAGVVVYSAPEWSWFAIALDGFVIPLLCAYLWLTAPRCDRWPNPYANDSDNLRRLFLLIASTVWIGRPIGQFFSPQHFSMANQIAHLADDLLYVTILYIRGCPAPPPKRERQPAGAEMLRALRAPRDALENLDIPNLGRVVAGQALEFVRLAAEINKPDLVDILNRARLDPRLEFAPGHLSLPK